LPGGWKLTLLEMTPQNSCPEKFKVQGSKFKVKSKGCHEILMLYG
jgi:hypothetical protein